MAQIIQKISVDVSNPNFFKAIVAKQYDSNSRFLNATLTHNGEKIEVLPTSTVTINARRKYGGEKSFYGVVNDDGTVTVPLTYWMLELEGTVDCDISVIDAEDKKLSTTKFVLEVEKASCKGENIEVDDDCDVVVKLIEDVNELKEKMANVSATDQEYNPTSENAQSGKALAPVFNEKIAIWQPNTEYKVGDRVIFADEWYTGLNMRLCYGKCSKNHTSPTMQELIQWLGDEMWMERYVYTNWNVAEPSSETAKFADFAYNDIDGNFIIDTYATKEEVKTEIANIGKFTGRMDLVDGTNGAYTRTLTKINDETDTSATYIFGDILDTSNRIIIDCSYGKPDWEIGKTYEIVISNNQVQSVELLAKTVVDQSYDSNSTNAQSGKAVAEALLGVGGGNCGTWEKIVDITTTEEVNGINATVEEFPDLAKCKEFIFRLVLPKTETALTLGALRILANGNNNIFRVNSVATQTANFAEVRCHTIIADDLIHTVGTEAARSFANVVGNANTMVGNNLLSAELQKITIALSDTSKTLPVGTICKIYGKVEG